MIRLVSDHHRTEQARRSSPSQVALVLVGAASMSMPLLPSVAWAQNAHWALPRPETRQAQDAQPVLLFDALNKVYVPELQSIRSGDTLQVRILRPNTFRYDYKVNGEALDYRASAIPDALKPVVQTGETQRIQLQTAPVASLKDRRTALAAVPALVNAFDKYSQALADFLRASDESARVADRTSLYDELRGIILSELTNVRIRVTCYHLLRTARYQSAAVAIARPTSPNTLPPIDRLQLPTIRDIDQLTGAAGSPIAAGPKERVGRADQDRIDLAARILREVDLTQNQAEELRDQTALLLLPVEQQRSDLRYSFARLESARLEFQAVVKGLIPLAPPQPKGGEPKGGGSTSPQTSTELDTLGKQVAVSTVAEMDEIN